MRYYVLDEHDAASYADSHDREEDVDNWIDWYKISATEALRLIQYRQYYIVVVAKISNVLYRLNERDVYELIKDSLIIDEQYA